MSALRREPPPRSPPTMSDLTSYLGGRATVLAGPAAIQIRRIFLSVPLRRSATGGFAPLQLPRRPQELAEDRESPYPSRDG
jgi:hypothetical protein